MTKMTMPNVKAKDLPPTRTPEQSSSDVEPFFRLYEIPGHLKHSPTSEYSPARQGWQTPLPAAELVPGGQRVHIIDPFLEYVPAEHMMHVSFERAPVSEPK